MAIYVGDKRYAPYIGDKRRRVMMPSGGKPYKRELAYIESTGTQYIDTKIPAYSTLRVETEVAPMNRTPGTVIGACDTGSNNQLNNVSPLTISVGAYVRFATVYSATTTATNPTLTVGRFYDVVASSSPQESSLVIDGTVAVTKTNSEAVECEYNMYLFCINNHVLGARAFCSVRIGYLKIYQGDTLVRDFIPVMDNSDVPCLYDKVSGNLFYNLGTGNFLYGELNNE